MRASKLAKTQKRCIHKNNTNKRKKITVGLNNRNTVGRENLENINEAVRLHKLSDDNNYWKVVPKDSREVYRARRRRQMNAKRLQERKRSKSDDSSDTRESRETVRKVTKSGARKVKNKNKTANKTKNQRQKRRSRSYTSESSYTSDDSKMSSPYATSMSTSDMDYE